MLKKILLIFIFSIILFLGDFSFAWTINFPWELKDKITNVSINTTEVENKGFIDAIEFIWVWLLHNFKVIIEWLLLLFLVYSWAMMIMSNWTNEEELSSAKRTFRYVIVWMLFINIPWTIYEALTWEKKNLTEDIWTYTWTVFWFINEENFRILIDNIIQFIQIFIFFIAVILLTLSAIRLIMSRWREDVMKEHKNNIFYSLIWLVFVWLIWVWKSIVFDGQALIENSRTFFKTMANFILLFAWPIAVFFLILAWYYFITSSWDEDRIKKAKHIVVNVILWTLILLASYTFLIDLDNFKIT
jgi:hypothetical protein